MDSNNSSTDELNFTRILLKSCIESEDKDVIFAINKEYNYLFFNDNHKKLIKKHYAIDVEIGMNALQCITVEEDREKIKRQCDIALSGEKYSIVESFGNTELHYFEKKSKPILAENGEIIGIISTSKNITEERNIRKSLQDSEEKFRTLIEETKDWVTIVDKNGNLQYTNGITTELFGITPENIIGTPFLNLVHPDDKEKSQIWFQECKEQQVKSSSIENRQINCNGKIYNMHWTCTFYYDTNGEISHVSSTARDISNLKRVEEDLKQSEMTQKNLIKNLNSGIVVHGPDTEILIVNDQASKLLGLTIDQLTGKSAIDPGWCFLHEDETIFSQEEYPVNIVYSTKNAIKNLVIGIVRPSTQDTVWVLVNAYPEFDTTGDIQQVVVTFIDITDRKQIERELKESEYFFKESQKAATIGSYKAVFSPNNIWTGSNVCNQIFGTAQHNLTTTEGWVNLLHPDSCEEVINFITEDVMKNNQPFNKEYKIIRPSDGETRWVLGLGQTITNVEGEVTGLIGTIQDITERKFAEKKLNFFQEYLTNIVNSMPSILITVDSELYVTQWNSKAIEMTNISLKNAINKPVDEVCHFLSKKLDDINDSIKTKKIKKETIKVYNSSHKASFYEITIFPLEGNNISGAVINIEDRTKEKNLETQLNQSSKMDAIGQLAGGVAHDFNNMLSGILSAAQLLHTSKNITERDIKFINLIIKASTRASDLTHKLLAFGRKGNLSKSNNDIIEIIDDVYNLVNRTIDKRIEIIIKNLAQHTMFTGDSTAIQNSIMNLCINASHAMINGGSLSIITRNDFLSQKYCDTSSFNITPGEFIIIEVKDTGNGIPYENLERIFEPFFTTKKHGEGTGLGLASAYGTIQNHNGIINVYSELDVGTVFNIYLPCDYTEYVEMSEPKESYDPTETGTILLIDDEEIIRQVGMYMLEDMGYDVITAKDGVEAIEIYTEKQNEIDLILSDMIMPRMNGSETFYKLKEINNKCKVIISSGFTKDADLLQLEKDGIYGFIQKPFNDSELHKLIKDTLAK